MLRPDKKEFKGALSHYLPKYCEYYYLTRAFEGFWMNGFAHMVRNLISSFPKFKKLEDEFLNFHMDFFSKSLNLRNSSVYFDGSKSVRRAEFFAERKRTFKMIHLIRDGRAFCNSFINNKGLPRRNLSIASKVWRKSIKKVEILRRRLPAVKILNVRYHDLCSSPQEELKRIWAFLGLNYKEAYMEFDKEDMHILGNRMRNEYSGHIREDLSWKKQLSQKEILLLNRLLKNELSSFNFI